MSGQGRKLLEGLPSETFGLLCFYVQSPQHMIPHLWRRMQWLAWAGYLVLAALAFLDRRPSPPSWPTARVRLIGILGLVLVGLGLSWIAIELLADTRVTLLQPFRMATVARGLALVALAPRLAGLWQSGDRPGRARAVVILVGLTGDGTMVVATIVELAAALGSRMGQRLAVALPGLALAGGLAFLARHDTESGHVRLLLGLGGMAIVGAIPALGRIRWTTARLARWSALAWCVPVAALVVPRLPWAATTSGQVLAQALVHLNRSGEVPGDDQERAALWCREHTPGDARFIGPPGAKTFRLWSRRSLAFNRAASPYHARGLADWAQRFRDHVRFTGSDEEFAHAYLADRLALERRYDALSGAELAALARRQGATHAIAPPGKAGQDRRDLELIHVVGRWAVYRVWPLAPEVPPIARR